MRKIPKYLAILGVCLTAVIIAGVGAQATTTYTGSLTSADDSISATGVWQDPGITTLEWTITQNNPGDMWHYEYTLSVPHGAISHFIVELSPGFTAANIANVSGATSWEIANYSVEDGNSNPNMPAEIYGVKFNSSDLILNTFAFDTYRMPVWGDFYAKDGKAGGSLFNTAWNTGLDNNDDPTAPAANGSLNNKILRPDTFVPEPSSMLVLLAGAMPLVISRFRKK